MDGNKRSWRRSPQRTISTSRLSGMTGGPTVPRRGYGRLSLTTFFTFAPTTDKNLAGTKPRYAKKPAGSRQLE